MDRPIEKYLQILEISGRASLEDIKQAYKDLAKVWHPDRFYDNPRLQKKATEKLKEINIAYEKLLFFYENKDSPHDGIIQHDTEQDVSCSEQYPEETVENTGSGAKYKQYSAWAAAVCTLVILTVIAVIYVDLKYKKIDSDVYPEIHRPDSAGTAGSADGKALPATPSARDRGTDKKKISGANKHISMKKGYFTLGSTKDEVLAIQGTPTQITGNRWNYGFSYIDFEGGRVARWYNSKLEPLMVRMTPLREPEEQKGYFTLGSTKDEVLAIQGTPTQITGNRWNYGFSYIDFEGGRVARWYNSKLEPLMVRMTPLREPEEQKGYFTLGSTKDEVLAIQGTPTQITGNRWNYGFSYIDFEGGRVARWYNSSQDPLHIEPVPPGIETEQ